jgi:hypothetical protein
MWDEVFAVTTLTPEQRQLIENSGDQPVRVVDPETKRIYILMSADHYERLETQIVSDSGKQMEPSFAESFREGWDDPALDVYNDLDPRRR